MCTATANVLCNIFLSWEICKHEAFYWRLFLLFGWSTAINNSIGYHMEASANTIPICHALCVIWSVAGQAYVLVLSVMCVIRAQYITGIMYLMHQHQDTSWFRSCHTRSCKVSNDRWQRFFWFYFFLRKKGIKSKLVSGWRSEEPDSKQNPV